MSARAQAIPAVAVARAPAALRLPALGQGAVVLTVFLWIGVTLEADAGAGIWRQRLIGLATWAVLLALVRREPGIVRAQVAVVVAYATLVEYTMSPFLGVYTYRLHNVPAFVPPGHGLVYLAALAIGRSALAHRLRRPFLGAVLVAGGAWALWGALLAQRRDVFGAILFVFLVRFILRGRSPLTYAGAFVVTTVLELAGTHIGTWEWSTVDPTGLFGVGNPPSGIPGAYCFFDQAGMALSPLLLARVQALRVPWLPALPRGFHALD